MRRLLESPLVTPVLLGWCGAGAVLFGLSVECNKPLPPSTAVDVARDVQCVAADEAKGVTDPATIALDCKLASAQVASDIIATMDGRARGMCPAPLHPLFVTPAPKGSP